MCCFIRKIAISKWKQNDALKTNIPSADAITGCLRTQENLLSIWESDPQNEDDALLALVSSGTKLTTIDIVKLTSEEIKAANLSIKQTPGETKFHAYSKKHFDITDLNYHSLGDVSKIILGKVINKKQIRKTPEDLLKILDEGIKTGKVKITDLKEKVREELEEYQGKTLDEDIKNGKVRIDDLNEVTRKKLAEYRIMILYKDIQSGKVKINDLDEDVRKAVEEYRMKILNEFIKLDEAIKTGKVKITDLNESVRKKLAKYQKSQN